MFNICIASIIKKLRFKLMIDKQNLGKGTDNSRLMTKLSVLGGIGALILAILILILGISSNFAGSDTFNLAILPYCLATPLRFQCHDLWSYVNFRISGRRRKTVTGKPQKKQNFKHRRRRPLHSRSFI